MILKSFPPIDVCCFADAGPSMMTEEDAGKLKSMNETKLIECLTPKLVACIPKTSMQVLVNSEKYAWIETGIDRSFFRKPDLFVVLSSFWAARGRKERKNDEGALASREKIVTLLVQSVCARIQKGVSSNVNLSSHLVDLIRQYGNCFDQTIQSSQAQLIMDKIIKKMKDIE